MTNHVTKKGNLNKRKINLILFIGIVLFAANLRAPLTSVGSLIPFIRKDFGISNTVAGMITMLPLLAFAFVSPFVAKISNRISMEWVMFLSLLLLMIGIIIRSLFFGTALIGLAIAAGNVLLPAFIKINFPLQVGLMTGIYAVAMNTFGSIASGFSVPFSSIGNLGWQGSLVLWALLAFVALLLWIPQLRKPKDNLRVEDRTMEHEGNIWKSKLAWYITIFMGTQSLLFYTLITWLPEIMQSIGYDSEAAGWLLFLMLFAVIPTTFIIPIIAEKMRDQRILSIVTASLFAVGLAGLLIDNQLITIISIISIGIASGSGFSLSMMLFSLRTIDGKQAAEMSGMAQTVGYLLAAFGPVLFGALHDLTNSWHVPILMLIILSITLLFVGLKSGESKVILSNSS